MLTIGLVVLLAAAQAAPQEFAASMRVPNVQLPANLPLANLHPGPGPDTLLALRNGSVIALRSWRVEGAILHYQNVFDGRNSILVEMIDMERSKKLNADRQVPNFQ